MIAALRSEYRKLVSTRMWWVLLIVMIGYLAMVAGSLAASIAVAPDQGGEQAAAAVGGVEAAKIAYSVANFAGYVFPLIIGTLVVTAEFRHKTITSTLLARPNRTLLLIAKLVASIPIGVLYGLLGTGAVVAAAATALHLLGDGAYLTEPDVLAVIGFAAVALTLWTVVGVALGMAVPNQVAAIVIVIGFTQLVEPLLRVATVFVDALSGVGRFMPGAAADAIIGSSFFTSMGGSAELLERWQGALVLVAYALVLAVIGRLTTFRRDIG